MVELAEVVGIDDLVGASQREAVRRDEHRGALRAEDPCHLAHDPLGIPDVLEGLHREDGGEVARLERDLPHVGLDGGAVLAAQGVGGDVQADGLAGRQQVVAVPDAAPEVEDPSGREDAVGEGVGRDVPLPGGVHPA
jgi:hypothetical protein